MRVTRRIIKNKRSKSELNMIPFLDILLVLLLIFMITTPVITQTLDVSLPKTDISKKTNEKSAKVTLIVVEVLDAGIYNLWTNNSKEALLDSERLVKKLKTIPNNKNYIFQIAASSGVNYQTLVDSMSLMQKAGIKDIGLLTTPIIDK